MELSPYVEGLRRELGSLTRFASDDVVQVARKLAEALESSVRLTLLEVLSASAAEVTTPLDDPALDAPPHQRTGANHGNLGFRPLRTHRREHPRGIGRRHPDRRADRRHHRAGASRPTGRPSP